MRQCFRCQKYLPSDYAFNSCEGCINPVLVASQTTLVHRSPPRPIPSQKVCANPRCQKFVFNDLAFCDTCAERLPYQSSRLPPKVCAQPGCGKPTSDDWAFCDTCAERLPSPQLSPERQLARLSIRDQLIARRNSGATGGVQQSAILQPRSPLRSPSGSPERRRNISSTSAPYSSQPSFSSRFCPNGHLMTRNAQSCMICDTNALIGRAAESLIARPASPPPAYSALPASASLLPPPAYSVASSLPPVYHRKQCRLKGCKKTAVLNLDRCVLCEEGHILLGKGSSCEICGRAFECRYGLDQKICLKCCEEESRQDFV